jgi:hypothetical protein
VKSYCTIYKINTVNLQAKCTWQNIDRLPYISYFSKLALDLYFNGEYQAKYEAIMKDFGKRGIIKEKHGKIFTTVKP